MEKFNALELLNQYIKNQSLQNHCKMVAHAMESYAKSLNLDEAEIQEWYLAGLLHDIDWEMYPDEHPNKAANEILPALGISRQVIEAIKAHAPHRTGKQPILPIEKYLFACDELSGFMNAVSLIRPDKFKGMEVKSIMKRLKEPRFAANVSREDIYLGAKLINMELEEHIKFLIDIFQDWSV